MNSIFKKLATVALVCATATTLVAQPAYADPPSTNGISPGLGTLGISPGLGTLAILLLFSLSR